MVTDRTHQRWLELICLLYLNGILLVANADAKEGNEPTGKHAGAVSHPRLYFSAQDLPQIRVTRAVGRRELIWRNMVASADWCRKQPLRKEWIPTIVADPQYENLYDRFYAAMHDMAIVETLAFASVFSDPNADPYFEPARNWLFSTARVWGNEAKNSPDASKAYAVLRITKGMAVGYDLLFDRLTAGEREEVRKAIVDIMDAYYALFQIPSTAGEGYNKHHGSVDASPFGVAALALLGEVPQADAWLKLAVEKHVEYLLPHALVPSGTNDQSSNFWASTLLYRIQFIEPLRRITGRDLLQEFPDALPGRIALAAVATTQPGELTTNECNRSVLFGPNYGQLNYWSPVLVYLARAQQRPIYQYLAFWDKSLGSLQHTRFITPTRHEELLFGTGPYALLWYDESVAASVEPNLPLAFEFPEPEVNEAYVRSSYDEHGLVVGMKKGGVIIHAGGRAVLVDQLPTNDANKPAPPVEEMLVADDGKNALIRCVGPKSADIGEQVVRLTRPGTIVFDRATKQPMSWWYMEQPQLDGKRLRWPDGTELLIEVGKMIENKLDGYVETPVHFGGMKFADPCPRTYATIKVEPENGHVRLRVHSPNPPAR